MVLMIAAAAPAASASPSGIAGFSTGGSIASLLPPTLEKVSPNNGPAGGGTEVTIEGTNFTGATAVEFGASSASFSVRSATRIKAIAPAGTGTVDVTVTTPEGTSAVSSADQFTYVPPGPAVNVLNPAEGPVKGGTKVHIGGFNLSGATAVDFGSASATSFTVTSSTGITAVSPVGTGVVDVTVTTPEGTSPITSADRYTYLGFAPGVSNVSPKKGPAAGGTTVTVSGANFIGASAVDFGSVSAASFAVVTSKSITAVTPAETAGRVNVTVTTPYGTSSYEYCSRGICSIRDYYKFVEPTVTNVTPNSGTAAGGTTVTVTGTGFAPGTTETGFLFGTTPGTSVNCASITTCEVTTPAHKAAIVDVRAKVNGNLGLSAINPEDRFTFG
jgi:IPT/TIG domain